MKTYPHAPAHPLHTATDLSGNLVYQPNSGLTKREHFAIVLMAALVGRIAFPELDLQSCARDAIMGSEYLIVELNELASREASSGE